MASEIQTPLTTENTEITERFQVGPSEAIDSDPRALDPLCQLADVDLILLGRVSLRRILLSVISVLSVVKIFSCLPESSPRLSAPAKPAVMAGWRSFVYRKDFRPVSRTTMADPPSAGVLLALYRVVVQSCFPTINPRQDGERAGHAPSMISLR